MGLFDSFREWRDRRKAFAELRWIKIGEEPYEHFERQRLIELMQEAAIREDGALAASSWEQLNILNRDVAITSTKVLSVLIGMSLFDLAERAITAGMARFPALPEPAEHYAILAKYQGDLEQAAIRWADVRRRFPHRLSGYTNGGECLMWLGRTDEAEALLATAIAMEPEDYHTAAQYAFIAEHAKNWEKALERWTHACENFGRPIPWIQSAGCLREMGRDPEAEALLQKADRLFGGNLAILTELAWIAGRRQDWQEALLRWQRVRDAFPRAVIGYLGAVRVYQGMGTPAEAEALLAGGMARNEDEADLYVEYARLAHNRADWNEAIQRWTAIRERFPDRAEGYDGTAAALKAAGRDAEAAAVLASRVQAEAPH
jgi:tetratricopeptide (TPR) repeat protein